MISQGESSVDSNADVAIKTNLASDEQELPRQYSSLYSDIKSLEPQILGFLLQTWETKKFSKERVQSLLEATRLGWQTVQDLLPQVSKNIVAFYIRKCSEPLKQVRSIPPQYRRTNKEVNSFGEDSKT